VSTDISKENHVIQMNGVYSQAFKLGELNCTKTTLGSSHVRSGTKDIFLFDMSE